MQIVYCTKIHFQASDCGFLGGLSGFRHQSGPVSRQGWSAESAKFAATTTNLANPWVFTLFLVGEHRDARLDAAGVVFDTERNWREGGSEVKQAR
jgi:hypothetical protein